MSFTHIKKACSTVAGTQGTFSKCEHFFSQKNIMIRHSDTSQSDKPNRCTTHWTTYTAITISKRELFYVQPVPWCIVGIGVSSSVYSHCSPIGGTWSLLFDSGSWPRFSIAQQRFLSLLWSFGRFKDDGLIPGLTVFTHLSGGPHISSYQPLHSAPCFAHGSCS